MARANTLDFKRRSFIPSKLATGALVEAGHWLVGRSELHLHEKRLLIWTFRACCLRAKNHQNQGWKRAGRVKHCPSCLRLQYIQGVNKSIENGHT